MALAGGVTVMTTPPHSSKFSRQQALARRSVQVYAGAADGTAWSKAPGCWSIGRLVDAAIWASGAGLVRGSAVNQDGTSAVLTAFNRPIPAAGDSGVGQFTRRARLSGCGREGTGPRTMLGIDWCRRFGDHGQDRVEPLWLGSIKSDIGHTSAAAGVAGVIKDGAGDAAWGDT